MPTTVKRIYVEKKTGFDVEASGLLKDLRYTLQITSLEALRIINRYDISHITEEDFQKSAAIVFAEPPVDNMYFENMPAGSSWKSFAVEYLPGQFDQRADSAAQCVQTITQKDKPLVRSAKVIMLKGDITENEFEMIRNYCINPVEARQAKMHKPESLDEDFRLPGDVEILSGFIQMDESTLEGFLSERGFAMDCDDIKFCQAYFRDTEKRDPTITELKILDTYWSDHCRHTTFSTAVENVKFDSGPVSSLVKNAWEMYLDSRKFLGSRKDVCLMDIATIAMKELKKKGVLKALDESEEINACSIRADVDVDGRAEQWLIMFKNETHNHPTEIEPFGGAATCLGGAIRDPLSGRSYVYQAMRVTGSGDPRTPIEKTLAGKLPQRKITLGAAQGYSSYGNQIGLATGKVREIYDEGYVAKRMEIGAVIGAAPLENVRREQPLPGDVVILLGGRTGRDGCGGATGSSKAHTEESLDSSGSEVQKGNPPVERKLQRLFRKKEVTRLIKRCNDFGAGGVSVAIGELADGLDINLDVVPRKYEGLDGTELAISESQERMAVVVAQDQAGLFRQYAAEENLEATVVAEVNDLARVRMFWKEKMIVDISRDFLDSNGASKKTTAEVKEPQEKLSLSGFEEGRDLRNLWLEKLSDLNVSCQKGLSERFDSTIGVGTVLMPFGGKYQLTPNEAMVAKVPVLNGATNTATAMSYGYDPVISARSPFHGAVYAVIESVSKLVALGIDYRTVYLTLQEYFEKLYKDPARWGKPLAALLGAYYAQIKLNIAAIGGKDSMSGSFHELDVPPTLVSFAVGVLDARKVISPEFKRPGSRVVLVRLNYDDNMLPDFEDLSVKYSLVSSLIESGKVLSSHTIGYGGIAEAISKMAMGNKIGFEFASGIEKESLFSKHYGSVILEMEDESTEDENLIYLGKTADSGMIRSDGLELSLSLDEIIAAWTKPLETVFPSVTPPSCAKIDTPLSLKTAPAKKAGTLKAGVPKVFIPVFPGTNCEYDSEKAFRKAGADVDTFVVRNLSSEDIKYSVKQIASRIRSSQIIMLPGGFSAGDEPDGSGKFIAAIFRNPEISDAVMDLLINRDGLILGICNGFQALIKLGLLPYGEIRELKSDAPTLTYNSIGRHVSQMVMTRVTSGLSPWLGKLKPGDVHVIPVSHGEGRFYADEKHLQVLSDNGQIATQYVDFQGSPVMDMPFNPNGSVWAVEGISSPDGRVLGKMGHSERIGDGLLMNIPGNKDQKIFEAGVEYFK